nr:Hsp70 family protein [Mycoplasmopsis bovis]
MLGQFNLGGIRIAPRGVPQIEVSFKIECKWNHNCFS